MVDAVTKALQDALKELETTPPSADKLKLVTKIDEALKLWKKIQGGN